MSYDLIDSEIVYRKRKEKIPMEIDGCMVQYLFDYQPGSDTVLTREYLCDYEKCLQIEFLQCLRQTSESGSRNLG